MNPASVIGVIKAIWEWTSEIKERELPVLVVDDNADDAEILAIYFRQHGASVITCQTIAMARERLLESNGQLRLVTLDVGFPSGDGVELGIWAKQRWRHLPVIFVTGHPESLVERLPAGRVWKFIAKGTGSQLEAVEDALALSGVRPARSVKEVVITTWILCTLTGLIALLLPKLLKLLP